MRSSSRERRARAGRWLLAANIVWSAAALGALHTPVLVVSALLAAGSTALLWYGGDALKARPAATTLVTVALVLLAWTTLQLVPLPRGLLAFIAPENADVWARALSPLREGGPSFAPLSLDPTATRVQLLRGVTYLLVYVGALRVAQRPEGIAFLERTLVVASTALAAAAVIHPTFGVQKVFGLYEPGEKHGLNPHHLAPLLNTNHLAAYMNVGMLIAFGAVITRREALPRLVAAAIVPLLGATTLWTLSRGGVASMLLGAVLVVGLTFVARRGDRGKVAMPMAAALTAVAGVAVLALGAFDSTRAKFAGNDLSKLALIENALELLRKFGIFGVGRGAFESVFPSIRRGTEYYVFTHPENIVAQWTTEWGVPFAVLGMFAIAWALRPQSALARSRPPVGAWAALVAATVHNFVDFSSEVPGVVIALAVCAAIVTGGSGGGKVVTGRVERWSSKPDALAIAGGVAVAVAICATLPFMDGELYREQRAFRDFVLDRATTKEAFHARVRDAMLRHPAEAYFAFAGAVRATAAHDESILPWAARALERSPVYGRVHILLARSLFVRRPAQARLEYRLACEQDRALCGIEEALPLVGGYDEALELVPEGPSAIAVFEGLGRGLSATLPATVWRLDREMARREPSALAPVLRAAEAALLDVKNGEPWCDAARNACVAEGLEAARRVRTTTPSSCDGHALTAELLIASGEVERGLDDLDHALDQVEGRSACGQRLVRMTLSLGRPQRTDAAIDRLLKLGCETNAECADNLEFAAQTEAARGNARRALVLAKRAADRSPERDDYLLMVANLASSLGVHGEALDAYNKLGQLHPNDPQWAQAAARERSAATRGLLGRP